MLHYLDSYSIKRLYNINNISPPKKISSYSTNDFNWKKRPTQFWKEEIYFVWINNINCTNIPTVVTPQLYQKSSPHPSSLEDKGQNEDTFRIQRLDGVLYSDSDSFNLERDFRLTIYPSPREQRKTREYLWVTLRAQVYVCWS